MINNELKYNNMTVRLINKGRLFNKNVAIKNVFHKENDIYFELYFYKTNRLLILNSLNICDLLDLDSDRYYKSVKEFYDEYHQVDEDQIGNINLGTNKLLSNLELDIVILMFLAKKCGECTKLKSNLIEEYIFSLIDFSNADRLRYVQGVLLEINPTIANYYNQLNKINSKTPQELYKLLECALKVCRSDGALIYNEKLYLSEFMQALRNEGVNIDGLL